MRIETERLLLRLPEHQDVGAIVDYYTVNEAHLRRWDPPPAPGFLTEHFWRQRVERYRHDAEAGTDFRLFLYRRGEVSRIIGTVSLTYIVQRPLHAGNLGYSLAASAQGNGYMSEAVEAIVQHAFTQLNLHRVTANYIPHNVRSGAVLRRTGFQVEGYARDYLLIGDGWADHILTARLNPNWQPPPA